jgi:hypothetical protein
MPRLALVSFFSILLLSFSLPASDAHALTLGEVRFSQDVEAWIDCRPFGGVFASDSDSDSVVGPASDFTSWVSADARSRDPALAYIHSSYTFGLSGATATSDGEIRATGISYCPKSIALDLDAEVDITLTEPTPVTLTGTFSYSLVILPDFPPFTLETTLPAGQHTFALTFDTAGEPGNATDVEFYYHIDITVPEPSTALLIAFGLAGLAVGRGRRGR